MTRFRLSIAVLTTALLQACMDVPQTTTTAVSTSTSGAAGRNFLFSWGMFADPVFDRDVVTFERAFTRAYGTPADTELFGYTSSRLADPDTDVMKSELAQMATQAVDGRDVVVVMLTSHGSPDVMAVKMEPNGPVSAVSGDILAGFLSPLANDQQILILQACFSGSLIDELRSPNRIIMTAASATRSSFGCNPESDNTWFIKSLNQSMAQGGSWQQVFVRTRSLVARDEAENGMTSSDPQSFVGANMRNVWTQDAI